MFAPSSGINRRPGTVPGLGLAHPQEQGQGPHQHQLHLLHASSSSSAATHVSRPKRKISSKPIPSFTEKTSSRTTHLPSQEPPAYVRNRNYATDKASNGGGVGGGVQSNNLMMNHSRQRVPSAMSTLSAFGSHNTRSSRNQDRTQQDSSLPFRGQPSSHQESNKEYQPNYLYSQDRRIHEQGSSREDNLRQQQQLPRSDPLTIRDILDRKELRDQISEMRRSINSNPDDPRRGLSPGQEFDPRLSPEVMAQHERLRKASEANRAGSAFWNPSQRVGPSSYNTRRPAQEDSVVTDLSMDHSLLEKQFREKLDAAIQISGPTNQEQKARSQQKKQYTPVTASSFGPTSHTTTTTTTSTTAKPIKNAGLRQDILHRSPPSERRARDLYHSSYSPSEFSQTEDLDNDLSQGDASKDGRDMNNTTDTRDSGTPTPTGVSVSMTTPRPTPSAIVTLAPSHSRPILPSSSLVPKNTELSKPATSRQENNPEQEQSLAADDSGEISFEREVARARAKRELGQSAGQSLNQEQRQDSGAGRGGTATPNVRKLDHGRGLALEDLASPTHFGFEAEEAGMEQKRGRGVNDGAIRNHLPSLAVATDLARMNIAKEAEDRFIDLAGSLGEGQAVASLLGTLKGIIRGLKREKRDYQSTIKNLQKDLKQSKRELERTRKAKEKLAKSRSTHAAASQNEGLRKSQKSTPHSKNAKTMDQQNAILLEQQETEARAAVIGKEKDLVESYVAKLQKQINALEQQREEIRKRNMLEAEEGADLLLLLESDSEDEDEDEDEDESSSSESESESEPAQDKDDQEEDLGATVRYVGRSGGGSGVNRPRGVITTEKASSLAKKTSRDNYTDRTLHRHSVRTSEDASEKIKSGKKSSASRSLRSKSGQVEEVHVHHHVHYEDEEILELLGIHSKSNSPTGQTALGSRKPSLGMRLDRVGEALEEHDRLEYSAEVHRVHLGTGFRSSRRGSYTEGSDGVHTARSSASSSREKHAPVVMDGPHVRRDYKSRSPLARTLPEEYPQRQALTTARSLLSSVRGQETRLDDNAEESRGDQSLALSNGPQKKIAINLPRILSLLKNHDPRRCTVCCDGGANGQKCTRHRYHEHKVVTVAAPTNTSPMSSLPSSQTDRRRQALHIGQLTREKPTATSGPIKIRRSTITDLQTESSDEDLLEADSLESDDSAADVGPARPAITRDASATASAAAPTSTSEGYMLRPSSNGIKTTKKTDNDLLLLPQEKFQMEVSQIAAEVQFFRDYLKRSTLSANPSADGSTSSTSKAAAASAI
ncbi:hypothetical protein EMPS_09573 [Entomortierella parvispora]|uniref:Uncharacterized protein n=1 Tax=Entomortierella parvispora TaxID=205924 RepID=A0A9P3M0E5_9FUNG|nr:hypothetical protein EMPS_09573 [Entomortierella parvispora]